LVDVQGLAKSKYNGKQIADPIMVTETGEKRGEVAKSQLEVEQEGLLTPDRLVDVSMGLEVKALSGDAEVRYYFGPDLAQWKLEVNLSQGKEKCNLSPHSQKNTGILDMGEKGIQVVDPTEGIELQIEVGAKSLFSVGENARLERPLEQINKGGGFFIPDMLAMGASMGLGDSILVGSVVDGQKPETSLAQMKMGAHISQCKEKVTHSVGKDGSDGKETASDDLELETQDEEWLMVQEPDTRKKNRKKLQVQATRQSLRLRNQGGQSSQGNGCEEEAKAELGLLRY
jgi:hypothetical protein